MPPGNARVVSISSAPFPDSIHLPKGGPGAHRVQTEKASRICRACLLSLLAAGAGFESTSLRLLTLVSCQAQELMRLPALEMQSTVLCIGKTSNEKLLTVVAVLQRSSSYLASCQRGKCAREAKGGKNDEGHVHTSQEKRIVFRCNLDPADV